MDWFLIVISIFVGLLPLIDYFLTFANYNWSIVHGVSRYKQCDIATVNLKVLAGVAKPNPKMGQALGPLGINMMKFCE